MIRIFTVYGIGVKLRPGGQIWPVNIYIVTDRAARQYSTAQNITQYYKFPDVLLVFWCFKQDRMIIEEL